MDANKAQKLREIGYQIQPCCGNCGKSDFAPNCVFGYCLVNTYDHQKHSEDASFLSIHKTGWCPEHALNPNRIINQMSPQWCEFVVGWDELVRKVNGG